MTQHLLGLHPIFIFIQYFSPQNIYLKKRISLQFYLYKFIIWPVYCQNIRLNMLKKYYKSYKNLYQKQPSYFYLWWLLCIQFYHIQLFNFQIGECSSFLFPYAFLCFPMIFYSSSCTFIQIYYSCFFTHFNNIFKYVVSVQYVYSFLISRPVFIFSVLFLFIWISSTGLLSIIIKAYSMGISNCTTTNILIRWFYCVHWIKPPFRKFPINDISPTYEIFSYPW